MSRSMDHLTDYIRQFQRGQLTRRQLLERGAALGLSAAGLAALGAINPVAGQEHFVRPALRAAARQEETETLQAALATAQRTGDLGPVDAMVEGMERGAEELGYETTVVEVVQGEYTEAVRALAASGTDLIIAAFPPMIDAIVPGGSQYPDQHFALIIGETPEEIPNVMSVFGTRLGSVLPGGRSRRTRIPHLTSWAG